MRCLKTLLVSLALVGVMFVTPAQSFAQTIGIVDADKIISSYKKAQDVESELKIKEAEIQTFIAEAQRKIKAAATPVEESNLQKELSEEFRVKQTELRKMQLDESTKINEDIIAAIKQIAQSQSIDIVLAKGAVFIGGTDITDEVLTKLNSN